MVGNFILKEHRNTYGGRIYEWDFDTDHAGSRNIAGRIAADARFDEKCELVRKLRKRYKKNADKNRL